MISPEIESRHGLLGSTFGGNHLACTAAIAVLEVIKQESLMENAQSIGDYFMESISDLPFLVEVRGKGLMIGLEFEFPVKEVRKELVEKYGVLTGNASNPNVLRILPSLGVNKGEINTLINALKEILLEKEKNETVYISKGY